MQVVRFRVFCAFQKFLVIVKQKKTPVFLPLVSINYYPRG